MKRTVPKEIMAEIEPDLERFGWRVVEDIWELGKTCERCVAIRAPRRAPRRLDLSHSHAHTPLVRRPENHPRLIHVDGWGNRVDRIVVHPAWVKLQEISAEEVPPSLPSSRSLARSFDISLMPSTTRAYRD